MKIGNVPNKAQVIEDKGKPTERISPKESKRRAEELGERIDLLGNDNEKVAAKAFQEIGKIEEEKEEEQKEIKLNFLDSISKQHNAYYHSLADMAQEELKKVDFPKGYGFHSFWTDRGVGIFFQSRNGRKFSQGFVPSLDPIIDMAACEILAQRAENTVDKLENREFISPGQIILPQ